MLKQLILAVLAVFSVAVFGNAGENVQIGKDGLHVQSWFFDSKGDIRSALQAAAVADKNLVVLFEQNGCVYCKKLHEVNFAKPEVLTLLGDKYLVVQMDMWGDGAAKDFNGQEMTETQLARKWGVTTTPTTLVLNASNPFAATLAETEAFRLPGYLKPFYYHSALDFFASGAFESQGFQAFLADRVAVLEAKGMDPELW